MPHDEVVDGLKRALTALQRERADIDEKIQLLQSTLAKFEDVQDSASAPARDLPSTESSPSEDEPPPRPKAAKKKGRRPRKKAPSTEKAD